MSNETRYQLGDKYCGRLAEITKQMEKGWTSRGLRGDPRANTPREYLLLGAVLCELTTFTTYSLQR